MNRHDDNNDLMSQTLIREHIRKYEELLTKVDKHDTAVNESTMQAFFEQYTAFMPTPFLLNHQLHFNVFISKLPIGHWVTDIAYLTKSTVEWWLVLMELENPHKKIFKGSLDHADFTSDYTQARQQIDDWKGYIEENRNEVINKIKRILQPIPMRNNRISFKYVMIMGRRSEIEQSEARRRAISMKNDDDFRIITYDTILSDYERSRRIPAESIVLSSYNGDRFKIKTLPQGKDGKSGFDGSLGRVDTHLFTYFLPEDLSVTEEHIKSLEDDGYEMESWLKGKALDINNKYTREGYVKRFPDNEFAKLLL